MSTASTKSNTIIWYLLLPYGLLTVILIFSGLGKLLNYVFPLGALIIAIVLYGQQPLVYTGFSLWLWFITPLIRRLADYHSTYNEPSPILIAPYLACLVSAMAIHNNRRLLSRGVGMGFLLAGAGVVYSASIAIINRPLPTVVIAVLDWLVPIIFGFYIYTQWQKYPEYRVSCLRVFKWGTLVMGIYGIYQFVVYPEWDQAWQINAEFFSVGVAEAFSVRIWSTMHAVGPFANTISAGILLLLNSTGVISSLALVAGILSFLLTLGRTAWISWVIALIGIFATLKPKSQIRLFVVAIVMSLLTVQLLLLFPSSNVGDRFTTFSNLENDGSAAARQKTYQARFDESLTSWLGDGLGGPSYDSGVLNLLLNLGWIGTAFYLGGLGFIIANLATQYRVSNDYFARVSWSIVFTTLPKLFLGGIVYGVNGIFLWFFIGASLAAQKYWNYELLGSSERSLQHL